jgi:D-serine deaminase-like pyridoxal phosphate-dependent protein
MGEYPRITADLNKIRHNLNALIALCSEYGVSIAAVGKVVCADEKIIRVFEESGVSMLADARLENLEKITTKKPKLLLRAPSPDAAEETVRLSDISLGSEIDTIRALGKAAELQKKRYSIILMIDLATCAKGFYLPSGRKSCARRRSLRKNLGMNCWALARISPATARSSRRNDSGTLCDIADEIRAATAALPIVSGGNSAHWDF